MLSVTMPIDAGAPPTLLDTRGIDGLSVEAFFSDGATSAVLELRRNLTGRAGDTAAFATAATLSASVARRDDLDVSGCDFVEVVRTTPGAAGELCVLTGHGFTRPDARHTTALAVATDGTAATPALVVGDDQGADCGLYQPADGQLGIAAAGSAAVVIDGDGTSSVSIETDELRPPTQGFTDTLVIGAGATASADNCVVIGDDASAYGGGGSFGCVAVGHDSVGGHASWAHSATAIGDGASCTHNNTTAIGRDASASGSFSTAIGAAVSNSAANSVAIGRGSNTSGTAHVAIGQNSSASHDRAICIGSATSAAAGDICLGSRQTTSLAPNLRIQGCPSTGTTAYDLFGIVSDWIDAAVGTRKSEARFVVMDANAASASVADTKAWRAFTDGTRGYTAHTFHSTAPADGDLENSEVVFYDDGSGNLAIKAKDSGGTVRTGSVTLT